MSSNGRARDRAKWCSEQKGSWLHHERGWPRRDLFVHISDIKAKGYRKLYSTKSASWYKIPVDLCILLKVPTRLITAWRGEPPWKRISSASSARSLARV